MSKAREKSMVKGSNNLMGIYKWGKKWAVKKNGKYLGLFSTILEASRAYRAAPSRDRGEKGE